MLKQNTNDFIMALMLYSVQVTVLINKDVDILTTEFLVFKISLVTLKRHQSRMNEMV